MTIGFIKNLKKPRADTSLFIMKSTKKAYNFFSWTETVLVLAILVFVTAILVPSALYIRSSSRAKMIEAQLGAISKAGRTFILENGVRRVSCQTLVRQNLISEPTIFYGEDYKDLVIDSSGGKLSVKTKNGKTISVNY